MLQFQKQSEVWGCWNDNALVEKRTDYRIILMLKHMVMSRKTPEWGVMLISGDHSKMLGYMQQPASLGWLCCSIFPILSSFHSCSSHWEGTCSSTAGTHSKDSRLCKYLNIYSSWNKLTTFSFGQNFCF